MDEHDYEEDGEGNLQMVKSLNSNEVSLLRFTNRSHCVVDVYWVDYVGKFQLYKTLRHREFFDLKTFISHPWIFRDSVTQERLLAKNKLVFRGSKTYIVWSHTYCRPFERREMVDITSPMRKLKNLALLEILKCLKEESNILKLGLPYTLADELKSMLNIRNRNLKS